MNTMKKLNKIWSSVTYHTLVKLSLVLSVKATERGNDLQENSRMQNNAYYNAYYLNF